MGFMNIDEELEVLETPARLSEKKVNGRHRIRNEGNSSVNGHLGNTNSSDEGVRHRSRDRGKVVTADGNSRSLSLSSPNNLRIYEKPECHNGCTVSALNSSSSSKRDHLVSSSGADMTARYDGKSHSQHKGKGKAMFTSQSSGCQEDVAIVDSMPQKRHVQGFEQAFGNSQVEETGKGLISANGFSSLNSMTCPSTTSGNDRKGKGKEKTVNACKGDSGFACGKGINFYGDSQRNAGKLMSASLNSIIPPKITGQKRLVRSGCESPYDILKATQKKHFNCPNDCEHNETWIAASNSPPNAIDLVAEDEDFHRVKGKGVSDYPFLAEEPGTKTVHLSSRRKDDHNFVNRLRKKRVLRKNEGDGIHTSTGNDSRKDCDEDSCQHGSASPNTDTVSQIMSQLDQFDAECEESISFMEKQKQSTALRTHVRCFTSGSVDKPHENSVLRIGNEDGIYNRAGRYLPQVWDAACQQGSSTPVAQSASEIMSQLNQFDAVCDASISFMEKQKQSSALRTHVGCFTSGSVNKSHENSVQRICNEEGIHNRVGHDFPQVWDAACQAGSSTPVAQSASRIMSWLDQFDEHCSAAISLNKRLKHSTSSDHGECSASTSVNKPLETSDSRGDNRNGVSNSNGNDSLGDLDADSSEHGSATPVAQTASRIISYMHEFDEHCDAAISHMERQNEESTFGEGSRVVLDYPQVTFLGSSRIPSYSLSNRVLNRHGLGISNPVTESEELMSRIGTLGSRNVGFSSNEDSDARSRQFQATNFMEAIETYGRTLDGYLLPVQRVSIESDYEALLALDDENTTQYVGASIDQINELPQATVQTNSLEECCAICLETLTTGDTIRHLPCLHKFHKDCIDPWLGIRTSCPVCKSPIF